MSPATPIPSPPQPELFPDLDQVQAHFLALHRPGEVREIRILDHVPPDGYGRPSTASGYFDTPASLAQALQGLGSQHASGIYITQNPVDPDLLARANNRLKPKAKHTTADTDIVRLAHLTLDFDPVRKAGISATDAELTQAISLRDAFTGFVREELGWPEPVVAMMSGNGGQVTWRIDLAADQSGVALVEATLRSASALFSTAAVSVDITLANPSQLVKLSGTVAAKGDALPQRPHRRAHSAFCPEAGVVSEAQLRALVALAPAPLPQPRPSAGQIPHAQNGSTAYDVPALLHAADIGFRERDKDWGRVFELDRCLSSDDHTDGAAILLFPSGAVDYHCFHNRCADSTWQDVKSRLGIPSHAGNGDHPHDGCGDEGGGPGRSGNSVPMRAVSEPERLAMLMHARSQPGPIVTAADLVTKVFPEPRSAVPGILAEGATLLVGAPKKGKSWLLLGLGVAIAAGGMALGKIPVEQGDVLLLCLEDNQRRLQERLWRLLDGEPAPNRLHLVTAWPRLDEGGDVALDAWLADHPDTRLVGVDVMARMRPPNPGSGYLYQRDYMTMAGFKAVADARSVPLAAVHHSRKASADDPLDTVSGTAGLAAAADTALILTREKGRADANLYVRGRDVPEADYALGFDPVTCQWTLLGDAAEYRMSAGRAHVVDLLRGRGPLGPKEIAEELATDRGTMRVLLHRMKNAGEVLVHDGAYSAPPSPRVTGVTPPENGATTTNSPVTPPVTPQEGVTPPVTGKNGAAMPMSNPVTPVTPSAPRDDGANDAEAWAGAVRVALP